MTFFAACGVSITSGFAAAVNELAFGANSSYGDACGRCFNITPTADPYELNYTGPFGQSIIVKVDNLCLDNDPKNTSASDPHWCGQTVSNPRNKFGMEMQCVLTFPWYRSVLKRNPIVALICVISREPRRRFSLVIVSRCSACSKKCRVNVGMAL